MLENGLAHAAHQNADALQWSMIMRVDGLELLHARLQDLTEITDAVLQPLVGRPPVRDDRAIVPLLKLGRIDPVPDGDQVEIALAVDELYEVVTCRAVLLLERLQDFLERRAGSALVLVAFRLHAEVRHDELLDGFRSARGIHRDSRIPLVADAPRPRSWTSQMARYV